MLKSLRIQNYALIDQLAIEFAPGLNVITGETGAGKSIIVGALSLLLGERADGTVIRSGQDAAVIEGVFRIQPTARLQALFANLALQFPDTDELVIRRLLSRDGRNLAAVNDHPVTLQSLRQLSELLIDLHGQHQHQSLLNREQQLETLDAFARLQLRRREYADDYHQWRAKCRQLDTARQRQAELSAQHEMLSHQLQELQNAQLNPEEIDQLQSEKELAESAERRWELVQEVLSQLVEGEETVRERLGTVGKRLGVLIQLDPKLQPAGEYQQQIQVLLGELIQILTEYREGIEVTPERTEEINQRLFQLQRLARKYLPTNELLDREAIEQLINVREKTAQLLSRMQEDEIEITRLERERAELEARLAAAANQLSCERRQAARRLEEKLRPELASLGLSQARLTIQIEPRVHLPLQSGESSSLNSLNETGADDIEFLFSANPGEAPKPLRKIASGGELSRIMLALKSVIAHGEQVPTMVFDEIDTGIGGRIADAVGRRLARIAQSSPGTTGRRETQDRRKRPVRNSQRGRPEDDADMRRQVICITHLPQIARFADCHLLVTKLVEHGRTVTRMTVLTERDRVTELARMFSGAQLTGTAISHARRLLRESEHQAGRQLPAQADDESRSTAEDIRRSQ